MRPRNKYRPEKNRDHLADKISKCIFLKLLYLVSNFNVFCWLAAAIKSTIPNNWGAITWTKVTQSGVEYTRNYTAIY